MDNSGEKNGSGNVGWPNKGIERENQDMDLDGYYKIKKNNNKKKKDMNLDSFKKKKKSWLKKETFLLKFLSNVFW